MATIKSYRVFIRDRGQDTGYEDRIIKAPNLKLAKIKAKKFSNKNSVIQSVELDK